MKFYQLPDNLIQEIDGFEKSIDEFNQGKIHPTRFRAIRVPMGIYEQREQNTYMMRIRCTAGGITPIQLIRAAELAIKYAKPIVHLTTRQEIQLHNLMLEDLPAIMKQLHEVGLSSRGGGAIPFVISQPPLIPALTRRKSLM